MDRTFPKAMKRLATLARDADTALPIKADPPSVKRRSELARGLRPVPAKGFCRVVGACPCWWPCHQVTGTVGQGA